MLDSVHALVLLTFHFRALLVFLVVFITLSCSVLSVVVSFRDGCNLCDALFIASYDVCIPSALMIAYHLLCFDTLLFHHLLLLHVLLLTI
jgi:hypothetical protein